MIRLNGVSHYYSVRYVLEQITLEISAGEHVTVIGPNGMGKSTLLAILAGTLSAAEGTVEVDGLVRKSTPENELAIRRKTYYLPDDPWMPMTRSGREFLISVGRLYQVPIRECFEQADRLLALFNLQTHADGVISSFSRGQKHKLSLCAALISRAAYQLWDEPFGGGLDPEGVLALKEVLKRYRAERRATVVITSPAPEFVDDLGGKILLLKEGRVLAFADAEELKQLAQGAPSVAEALRRLVFPHLEEKVAKFFQTSRD